MMITTLSVAFAVLVIKLHYKCPDHRPPQWMRVLIFHYIARLVFMDNQHKLRNLLYGQKPRGLPRREMTMSDTLSEDIRSNNSHGALSPESSAPGGRCVHRESYELLQQRPNNTNNNPISRRAAEDYPVIEQYVTCGATRLRSPVGGVGGHRHTNDLYEENLLHAGHVQKPPVINEWRKMAEVLDRFFFWMFLVFLIVPTSSILGIVRMFKPVL